MSTFLETPRISNTSIQRPLGFPPWMAGASASEAKQEQNLSRPVVFFFFGALETIPFRLHHLDHKFAELLDPRWNKFEELFATMMTGSIYTGAMPKKILGGIGMAASESTLLPYPFEANLILFVEHHPLELFLQALKEDLQFLYLACSDWFEACIRALKSIHSEGNIVPTCHYILAVVLRWVLGFQWMTLLRRFQGLEQTRRSRRMTAQISHWDVRSGTHQWSELQEKYEKHDILMSPQLCFITIGQVREQLKLEAAAVRMPQVTFDHLVWWSWISSWIVKEEWNKETQAKSFARISQPLFAYLVPHETWELQIHSSFSVGVDQQKWWQ